jgi:hypothetical protein
MPEAAKVEVSAKTSNRMGTLTVQDDGSSAADAILPETYTTGCPPLVGWASLLNGAGVAGDQDGTCSRDKPRLAALPPRLREPHATPLEGCSVLFV